MTLQKQKLPQKSSMKPTTGQLLFGWFSIFCLLLIFKNSTLANLYIQRGLQLCAQTVIPSLFPFMVLSEILISGGFGEHVVGTLSRPLCNLFRLPATALCAMLLGILCGFPVGARGIAKAYRNGTLSKEDAEWVLPFANLPSPAFVIGVIGTSLWHSTRFGIVLYLCVTSCSLILEIFLSRIKKKKKDCSSFFSISDRSLCCVSGTRLFTDSMVSATAGILSVCAYVVFFSAFMGAIEAIFLRFSAPSVIFSGLSCILELSQGVSTASELHTYPSALLCAFACGWSGCSVHCQVISSCDGLGLSFRNYFFLKLLLGILCVLLFAVLIACFPWLLISPKIG